MRIRASQSTKSLGREVWGLISGFGLAFILYHSMAFAFNTPDPLTAVLSDSMVPVFYKGDMLVVYGAPEYHVGDIVVYENPATRLPIVHRIINITEEGSFITKGDANPVADPGYITPGPIWSSAVNGKVVLRLPFLGWVKILFMRYVFGMDI